MSIVIGIDSGINATKIVGIENGTRIMSTLSVKSEDHISSIYGALGKFIHINNVDTDNIEQLVLTGVGATHIDKPILNLPTQQVNEFKANGLGARFDSGLDHIIVVSMGTGTSLVRVDDDEITHIGGIGMGGGTLLGLSKLLLHTTNISDLLNWSEEGTAFDVNLTLYDVYKDYSGDLDPFATASLFAKAAEGEHSKPDIAAGLVRMVLETIGSCAVLSQRNNGCKDFVLIGSLTQFPMCKDVFRSMEQMYGVHFHIPKYAPYCTALGAALSYRYENE